VALGGADLNPNRSCIVKKSCILSAANHSIEGCPQKSADNAESEGKDVLYKWRFTGPLSTLGKGPNSDACVDFPSDDHPVLALLNRRKFLDFCIT